MDNPALDFAIDNQADLFGNAPIVFCGINNYTHSLLKGRSDVTGIVEAIDIAETIEVMLRLHPATQEIFSPNDYTMSGLAVRKELEALVPRFGARVRFLFNDPLTMEELLKEIARLPKDSLILAISFITDKSGGTFDTSENTKLFARYSPVPIYSTYQQRLGFGIVGGKLLSARIHGADAARIALRVLAGENASAIPVVFESDSQFMFDYKVMRRLGIPLSALPEGSTVINNPLSFYATHRAVIQTALGIIGFLLIVTFLLAAILTQRRRGAITLRRSEENFRNSLDESPLGVRIVTEEGETLYANRAILDIYGYDSIEKLKATPVDKRYTTKSHADFLIRREKRRHDIDDPAEYTVDIIRKDGDVRCLEVLRKTILWDGERQFQVLYKDITETKQAEKALREREEFARVIADFTYDWEYWVAPDGTFVYVSPSCERISGYRAEEFLQNPKLFENILHRDDKNLFIRHLHNSLRGNSEACMLDFRIISCDDKEIWIEHACQDIFDNAGKYLGRRGSNRDITKRKQAEEELRLSRERFRALAGRLQEVREEERTQIAREIHDELGGALTGLKIDFSLLKKDALKIENETVRASLLADIDPMIKFTDATIHTVRRIAMELRPGVLDDLGLVAALEWQLNDFEKRTGIRCEWISSVKYIDMDADLSTALFRIVQEALTNVARHSGATEARVHLRADTDCFILEVEDNGKGIEKKKTMSSKSLGLLGMGERALMFGGRITVTGTPGTGTKVTVEIPPVEKRISDQDQEGDAG